MNTLDHMGVVAHVLQRYVTAISGGGSPPISGVVKKGVGGNQVRGKWHVRESHDVTWLSSVSVWESHDVTWFATGCHMNQTQNYVFWGFLGFFDPFWGPGGRNKSFSEKKFFTVHN